jgi:hypothetical protein
MQPFSAFRQGFGIHEKDDAMESLCESDTLEMSVNISEYLEKLITHLKK